MVMPYSLRRFAVLFLAIAACAGQAVAAPVSMPDRAAIQRVFEAEGALTIGARSIDRFVLEPFYQKHDFQPIWTEPRVQSFAHALDDAPSHGIDLAGFVISSTRPAERELLLSDALLRYGAALARGRVSPADFETDWRIAAPSFDGTKLLESAIAGDIASVLADLAPHAPSYERLREALQHYLELAKTGWPQLRVAPMRPGDYGDNVRALRDRLASEGITAPPDIDADPSIYDGTLAAAVSQFQTSHGLTVDGAAGRATLAALNVSAVRRVKQIRLNLERWRSLPRFNAALRVEVNVPAATAVLFQDDHAAKTMRAIVGAVEHPTPMLRARMISVLFNPPWNVPSSIIEKEIRPTAKRDPRYMQRVGLVYIDVNGGRQLVQLPGPKNALGQIKFEMPNPDDIYMHDTPDRRLFALSRRALSHGCVRVEDPRDFARFVLNGPEWSPEAIDRAIATGQTQSVALPQKIPVYMLYWTAFVDPDGTIEFRDDLYGRDRRLAEALTAQEAADHLAIATNSRSKG
jgi:murein L,D-transpeptidase YcbB/YkuD